MSEDKNTDESVIEQAPEQEQDTQLESEAPAEVEAPEAVEPPAEPSAEPKTGRPLALAALAVSILALAGVGAGGWMAGQQVNTAQAQQSQIASQLASLTAQVQGLQSATAPLTQLQTDLARVDAAQAQVLQTAEQVTQTSQAVAEQLQTFVDDLSDTRTRIELIEGNRAQEYLLAEVEYLLRIAVQRIQAGRDVTTGLSLMQSADQSLAAADDAALFPVRRALAGEIAQLKAIPRVDRNGMYLALAAAADQVDNLSIGQTQMRDAPQAEVDSVQGMMKTLSSFVTIRTRDQAIEPLMSPVEEVYARQNLRLMIEQAQLAILDGDRTAWQASLDRAGRWIERHFEADSQTQSLSATLAELSQAEIAPRIPAVGAALAALKDVQKARDAALGGQ